MSLFDVSGRVVVVIGATSGIGREIGLGFAKAGAAVVPTGRRADRVAEVCAQIGETGGRCFACACDASDRDSLENLKRSVLDEFGQVDVLVYAAGQTAQRPTLDVTKAEWNHLIDVNVTGALAASQAFYEPLKRSGGGRIVNIASLASFVSFHQVAAYNASKSALLSLTKSLGCEWAKDGIRTNAIVPGVIVTDLNRDRLIGTVRGRELLMRTPAGRFGDTSELVGAAIFLASDASSFMTGTYLVVDGGFLASGVNS